ncbi:MAG: DUF6778 family protein [Pseudomonadota bacterium]
MYRRQLVLSFLALTATTACTRTWETAFDENPSVQKSSNWHLEDLVVIVPDTLTLSDEDQLAPDADIVWHGEAPGDTRSQVEAILDEAAEKGTAKLKGNGPRVTVEITLEQFHSITRRARRSLSGIGVHNIQFGIRVIDIKTNQVLAEEAGINAALPAYSGLAAVEADAIGETQRVRVVRHVSAVISAWLGTGPDVRSTFERIGR